jgi:SAM-dependent methyltransferase
MIRGRSVSPPPRGNAASTNGIPVTLNFSIRRGCTLNGSHRAAPHFMSQLNEKPYWDSIHVREQKEIKLPASTPELETDTNGLKATVKKVLGASFLKRISNYDDYLLTEVILPRVLPDIRATRYVEIGSAPGEFIAGFSKRYGCIPYGVEYSDVGVEVNRRVFEQNGFGPDNVIHKDFFSDEFADSYRNYFDGVLSRGFIEHFEDVTPVIDRHSAILKPGGYLIISVPNLRGFNYFLSRFFDESSIARHNLRIMTKNAYAALFQRPDLQSLFCGYYGTFNFYLFTGGPSAIRNKTLRLCHRVQPALNFAFRTACRDRGIETGLFSPSLLYIGRKVG